MEGKRATLNNPVYAEILYKIADQKIYPTQFVEEFRNVPDEYDRTNIIGSNIAKGFSAPLNKDDEKNFGMKWNGEKYRKNIPTLYRQLMKLHKKGYLFIDEEGEKGKKHLKNKKYFGIKWEKIVEEFTKRAIKTVEEQIDNEKDPWESSIELLVEMKAPEYLEKAKKNTILQNFFKTLFVEIRQGIYYHRPRKKKENHLILNELFDLIIEQNLLDKFSDHLDQEIGINKTTRSKTDKKSLISKTIGEEFVEDYSFFSIFCVNLSPVFGDDKLFIVDLFNDDVAKYAVISGVLHELNPDFAKKWAREIVHEE